MKISGLLSNLSDKISIDLLQGLPNDINVIPIRSSLADTEMIGKCIAIADEMSSEQITKIAGYSGLPHIVHSNSPEFETDLVIASRMISEPQEFFKDPIGCILALCGESTDATLTFPIKTSQDKGLMLEKMRAALQSISQSSNMAEPVLAIADELFTNAIYNAPTDKNKAHLYKHRSRNAHVKLDAQDAGEIFLARNATQIIIGAKDRFGSLNIRDTFLRINSIYKNGVSESIHKGPGGAGIGMHRIFEYSSTFYLAVDPGVCTVICCAIPLKQSTKKRETLSKNIHVIDLSGGNTMGAFAIHQKKDGDKCHLEIVGNLDEDAHFDQADLTGTQHVVLDFAAITGINSCGIREWIKWTSALPKTIFFTYKNIPKVMVEQMNMVQGFLHARTKIESFFVPYYCESCDVVTQVLYENGKQFTDSTLNIGDTSECTNCHKPAELDIIEGKYFKFLKVA